MDLYHQFFFPCSHHRQVEVDHLSGELPTE